MILGQTDKNRIPRLHSLADASAPVLISAEMKFRREVPTAPVQCSPNLLPVAKPDELLEAPLPRWLASVLQRTNVYIYMYIYTHMQMCLCAHIYTYMYINI